MWWRLPVTLLVGHLGIAPWVGLGFLIGWEGTSFWHTLAMLGLIAGSGYTGWAAVYWADRRWRILD